MDHNQVLESLNRSSRCGFSSNARQIRPTVDFDSPQRRAIFARDQCVAFFGVDSNVATTMSSTWAAVILGGRPGLGSSTSAWANEDESTVAMLAPIAVEHLGKAVLWSRSCESSFTSGRGWYAAVACRT